MNYMDSRSHFRHVMANLRKLLPWVLAGSLLFMGAKAALATYLAMK
jgi:cephalosporin hydroxylase